MAQRRRPPRLHRVTAGLFLFVSITTLSGAFPLDGPSTSSRTIQRGRFPAIRGGVAWRQKGATVLQQQQHQHVGTQPPESPENKSSSWKDRMARTRAFCDKNFFLMGMFVAVGMARAFPALGKSGGVLRPELFLGKYGVGVIFLLSGLSLQVAQLREAMLNVRLNVPLQLYTFAVWPFLIGLPLQRLLPSLSSILFTQALMDGQGGFPLFKYQQEG